MKYSGSCHCQAVKFKIKSEQIEQALQCNCSICIRKNAIMSKQTFGPEQFTLLSGQEALQTYLWQDKDVNHYFCKHCGIYPFHDTRYEPGHYRVNLGCIEALNPRGLDTMEFDGKNQL